MPARHAPPPPPAKAEAKAAAAFKRARPAPRNASVGAVDLIASSPGARSVCMSSESLFCRDCGALLDVSRSSSSKIGCIRCPYSVALHHYCNSYTRVSSSRAKIDYNALYSKLSAGEARASVNETCPKCQHGVCWFKSVQMRSADEGETVFYECQVRGSAALRFFCVAALTLVAAGMRAQVEPEQLTRARSNASRCRLPPSFAAPRGMVVSDLQVDLRHCRRRLDRAATASGCCRFE